MSPWLLDADYTLIALAVVAASIPAYRRAKRCLEERMRREGAQPH